MTNSHNRGLINKRYNYNTCLVNSKHNHNIGLAENTNTVTKCALWNYCYRHNLGWCNTWHSLGLGISCRGSSLANHCQDERHGSHGLRHYLKLLYSRTVWGGGGWRGGGRRPLAFPPPTLPRPIVAVLVATYSTVRHTDLSAALNGSIERSHNGPAVPVYVYSINHLV